MKKSNVVISCICAVSLTLNVFMVTSATTGTSTSYNSQGVITFDNETVSTSDDVIFDSSDFARIDAAITSGKIEVEKAINEYKTLGFIVEDGSHTHLELANEIRSLTNDATASPDAVLSGQTFYKDQTLFTGTMLNNGGKTVSTSTIEESGDDALISIPTNAYYSTSSKISVPIETIKKEVPSVGGNSICNYIESIEYTLPNTDGRGNIYVYINNDYLNIESITFNSRPASYWRLKDVTGNTDTELYYGYNGDGGVYPKTFDVSTTKKICIMYQAINTNNQIMLDDTTVTITKR